VTKRRPLEERIEWLETFPRRMTIGTLLKALRIVARLPEFKGDRNDTNDKRE
jgi:hypothetical protein